MRFLLDSNVSHRVAAMLRGGGLDAEHVRDHGLQAEPDAVILAFARDHGFVVVSEDTDLGELLARQRAATTSIRVEPGGYCGYNAVRVSGHRRWAVEIGVRELRDKLSRHLAAVQQGRTVTITDRGRAIARIVPVQRPTRLEVLREEGRVRPGRERKRPAPDPVSAAGTVSDLVDDQRR